MPAPSNESPARRLNDFNLSSSEAEKMLLALILGFRGDSVMDKCEERRVTPEFFSIPAYSVIYNLIQQIRHANARGASVDLKILRVEVAKRGILDEVGGDPTLDSFEDLDVNPAADDVLIQTVIDVFTASRIHQTAVSAIRDCRTRAADIPAVLDHYQTQVLAISEISASGNPSLVGDFEEEVLETLKSMRAGVITGVPTGIGPLDELTGGLQPKDMVVIAARPSVGKTALALHIALNMALPKGKERVASNDDAVLFFSLEMSAKQLAMRAYSACSGINPRRVADGLDDLSRWDEAMKLIKQAPLLIHDPSGCTPLQMAAIARRERKKRRIKAIIVDYLQLIEHPNASETPREQQVSYFSRNLKKMAKDLDLPVIVLCQLNRDPAREQRKPRVSDLRESGAIEQDADLILLLSRAGADGFGNSDYLLADLAKHRNGPTGEVYLHFNGGTNTFRQPTDEEIKNLRGAF